MPSAWNAERGIRAMPWPLSSCRRAATGSLMVPASTFSATSAIGALAPVFVFWSATARDRFADCKPLARPCTCDNARRHPVFPGSDEKKARALPPGLKVLGEDA
jgi:hypothetical protein